MQKKTMLVAALTVTATLAGFVVAGTALGADWHEYDGRVSAGQAYTVPVPAGAESLSFVIIPNEDATAPSAKLAVFDADDARVGHYALDESVDAADVVSPISGEYVLYVYELREATLSVRLQAKEFDSLLLGKAETVRSDKIIVRGHDGAPLAKEITIGVKEEPVFATILYQGTVENLDATLDSPIGTVLTIAGESGTSYAPGVGVGSTNARTASPEFLAAGIYSATVKADSLDGSLYLTTLTYKRPVAAPTPVDEDARPAKAPVAPQPMPELDVNVQGAPLAVGVPTEVEVRESILAIALPGFFKGCFGMEHEAHDDKHGHGEATPEESPEPNGECMAAAADEHDDHDDCECLESPHSGSRRSRDHERAVVSVFDGNDDMVGVYVLESGDDDFVILNGLESGNYVMFAHGAHDEDADKPAAYVIRPEDPEAPLVFRQIALVKGERALGEMDSPLGHHRDAELKFATPPLGLAAWTTDGTTAVDYRLVIESPEGAAWQHNDMLQFQYFRMGGWYYGGMDREAFVAGTYTVTEEALAYYGDTVIAWKTYDRNFAFGESPKIEEPEEIDEDDDSDDEEASTGFQPVEFVTSLVTGLF